MHTQLLHDVPPCTREGQIHARLARMRPPPAHGGVPPLRVGVEGVDGRVYRVIESTSLLETVGVFEVLGDLGLECGPGRVHDGRRLNRVFREA